MYRSTPFPWTVSFQARECVCTPDKRRVHCACTALISLKNGNGTCITVLNSLTASARVIPAQTFGDAGGGCGMDTVTTLQFDVVHGGAAALAPVHVTSPASVGASKNHENRT
jgi:hypothetical protein